MTPSEAAKVLAVAVTFDARLTPPSREDSVARAQAWAMALDQDMTEQEAIRMVVEHYRRSAESIMPAMLNQEHRRTREQNAEREAATRILEQHRKAAEEAVPMPPEIREAINRLLHRKSP